MRDTPRVLTASDAEPALSDDDLDGLVGGAARTCSHGSERAHSYEKNGREYDCPGPGP